jgi:hypothetical protein
MPVAVIAAAAPDVDAGCCVAATVSPAGDAGKDDGGRRLDGRRRNRVGPWRARAKITRDLTPGTRLAGALSATAGRINRAMSGDDAGEAAWSDIGSIPGPGRDPWAGVRLRPIAPTRPRGPTREQNTTIERCGNSLRRAD